MQKVRKAYNFRLKTNRDIESKLLRFCGSSRFLWNKCLALNLERLVEVDSRHTSQRCSCCSHKSKENRPSQAVFRCLACGYEENADVNAAKNILTAGQEGLVCEANRVSDRQQKPARNREGVLPTA